MENKDWKVGKRVEGRSIETSVKLGEALIFWSSCKKLTPIIYTLIVASLPRGYGNANCLVPSVLWAANRRLEIRLDSLPLTQLLPCELFTVKLNKPNLYSSVHNSELHSIPSTLLPTFFLSDSAWGHQQIEVYTISRWSHFERVRQ
ncbi:unnamed protein product [Rodentolepis nana]|uniref:FAA_hydrolase domain-containing protein n=1 Tax=Rodentolepis nana TaxID=102285 RepID=A0A0R3TUA4_RODNA|nr:unnamed protein product [Rodentolepis nana]